MAVVHTGLRARVFGLGTGEPSNGASQWVVKVIADELSGRGRDSAQLSQYIAIDGFGSFSENEIPAALQDQLKEDIKRLLNALAAADESVPVKAERTQYTFELRKFADLDSARKRNELPKATGVKLAKRDMKQAGELGSGEEPDIQGLNVALRDFVARLPVPYDGRKRGLRAATDVFRREIAAALESSINAAASARPRETYEEKKALATWINNELRQFGLALNGPGSEEPCLLMANPGGRPGFGRFMLYYTDEEGKRHDVQTSVSLPPLKLVPANLSRAPHGQRTSRAR